MEIEPHPKSRDKAVVIFEDYDEQLIFAESVQNAGGLLRLRYERRFMHEAKWYPRRMMLTHKNLGKIAAGIEDDDFELEGSFDDSLPRGWVSETELVRTQIKNYLDPPQLAQVLPFKRRAS